MAMPTAAHLATHLQQVGSLQNSQLQEVVLQLEACRVTLQFGPAPEEVGGLEVPNVCLTLEGVSYLQGDLRIEPTVVTSVDVFRVGDCAECCILFWTGDLLRFRFAAFTWEEFAQRPSLAHAR